MAKHDWAKGDKDGASEVCCLWCKMPKTSANADEECPHNAPRAKPKFMGDTDFDWASIGARQKAIREEENAWQRKSE